MNNELPLRGLRINGEPFFARARQLTLTGTSCPRVLKLSWLVPRASVASHFTWLLTRLERCAAAPQPWAWESHPGSSIVRFRAWLVSPIGHGGDALGSLSATFRLHCHLAPDDPAEDRPPAFCPIGCHHEAPPLARDTHTTPPSVKEALRQARRQLFADMLNRWFHEEPHEMPKDK